MGRFFRSLGILLLPLSLTAGVTPPPLKPWDVTLFFEGVREAHARTDKALTPELAQRILVNYVEMVDPGRLYLTAAEVAPWLHASPDLLEKVCQSYKKWQFTHFAEIDQLMVAAIGRRSAWHPPEQVVDIEWDEEWASSDEELARRWRAIQYRSQQMAQQLFGESSAPKGRMAKRRAQWEERWTNRDRDEGERLRLARILKSSASALDDHTVYLTPQEAKALQIDMEQKLVGIGVQLRDDLDLGFTITRVLDKGPAQRSGQIESGDRIAAIDGESVVGLEVDEVVEKIRGRDGTNIALTLLRTVEGACTTVQVDLKRAEVVFEGRQCETHAHPFGKGVIGHIALHTFYGDKKDRSSTGDVEAALTRLSKEHQLLGVILDLRQNGGGLLGEALQVAALFLPNGAEVIVAEPDGGFDRVLSTRKEPIYEGPLLILTSRASASGAEIVAQALQEAGRAIVVGDERTFGKGSYQVLSNQLIGRGKIDPKGEFKVTRGCYYTPSGRTPQLEGVVADLVVPSPLSEAEVGERWSRYPLQPEPLQLTTPPLTVAPQPHVPQLRANSRLRLDQQPSYAQLVTLAAAEEDRDAADHVLDLQLVEAFAIMKDLLVLREGKKPD